MPETKQAKQAVPSSSEQSENLQVDLSEQKTALNVLEIQLKTGKTTTESKQATQSMAEEIEKQKFENLPLKTYAEVVKNTPLEQKLNKILSHPDFDNAKDFPELQGKTPEQRVEYIFQKINSSISRFYARKFDLESNQPVPAWLHQAIVPATEIFLMEMLKENKQQNNVNFLGQLSSLKIDGLVSAFQSVKSFAEKFTLPYKKAKSLMNILDFLALPKHRSELKKLSNPYELYQKVMQSKIWENDALKVENVNLSQFGLSFSPQDENQSSPAGLEKIKAEIGSIQVVDSPETVKKLLSLVGKSDEILKKTGEFSDQLLDSMDGLKSVDQTLQNTFGFNLFKEIKESSFLKGVADFFLNLLGFSGGLEGLERRWRKRNVDREIDNQKKEFISQTFESYLEKKGNADLETTKKIFAGYEIKVQEQNRGKFALDYPLLEGQIIENLDHLGKINPQLLASLAGEGFNGADFVQEDQNAKGEKILKVKSDFLSSEANKKAFCKLYFPKMLKALADNEDYLKTVKSPDDIAFMMVSGVSLETTNLIEGVSLGAIIPEDFYDNQKYPRSQEIIQNTLPSRSVENEGNYGNTSAVINNNPGNIQDTAFGGKKVPGKRFTVFDSPQEGYDALVAKIKNIQSGGSKVYSPDMSLLDYIRKYAPEGDGDNNPKAYAESIAKTIGGISIATKIKDIDTIKLANAHSKYEDGNMYRKLKDLNIIQA